VAGSSSSDLQVLTHDASLSPTIYAVSDGVLTIKEGTAAAASLTPTDVTIRDFAVQNLSTTASSSSLRITFTAEIQNTGGRTDHYYSETFSSTVDIRK
jgi:hypothetical protein